MSSPSWRSLLGGFLGRTMATGTTGEPISAVCLGEKVPEAVASNSKLHVFTFAELSVATGGFASGNKIGQGGFGTVYRGIIKDGVTPGLPAQAVAVKRGLADDYVEELLKEAMFLSNLQARHPSLVKMIGYCCEAEHRLLVYEFMGHGSLDHYLSKPVRSELLWSTRLNIAIAAAKGLASLHGAEKPLICGEFSSSDILLDSNNNAKIMLSGLRLDTRGSDDDTFVTSRVGRTPRGWAPEYMRSGRLTPKSDVHSFAMVLLEILITGLKEQYLVVYARPGFKDPRRLARIMDRELKGLYPVAAAREVALLASKCLEVEPERRPSMSDVVEALERLTDAVVPEVDARP
ncbi:unnamed protein product [Alopecurus aequalis]